MGLNHLLKRVHHDKKTHVILNLFQNLEFGYDNKLNAFVLEKKRPLVLKQLPQFVSFLSLEYPGLCSTLY